MERRHGERRSPDAIEPVSRVRLRTGRELSVVDLSSAGALVEGARLLPGTHVDVHVTTHEGRVLVRSRVVRAYVAGLKANDVCYRSALAFDRLVDTAHHGYRLPSLLGETRGLAGTDYPNLRPSTDAPLEQPVVA